MNKTILLIIASCVTFSTLSFAETSERLKATGENIQGNTQEMVGNLTNDPDLKNKGKANKMKGKLRQTKEDIKDVVTND